MANLDYCHVKAQVDAFTNQPDPQPMKWDDVTLDQELRVIGKLAEIVQEGTNLVWHSSVETRIITNATIDRAIAEDVVFMLELMQHVYEGKDACKLLLDKFDAVARDQIDEAMSDYGHMPAGFKLEDFL